MWTVLRDGAFRRLWLAATVDAFGTWLLVTAVPLEVFARTGSPVSTALALAVEAGPALLLGPWAGVLVDRWPRRPVLIGADLLAAAGVALLLHPGFLYAGLIVESVAVCFIAPAMQATVPAVAPDLAAANAALAVSQSTWRIVGPLLGAAVTAAGQFPLVVAADAVSYLAAAALIARLPALGTASKICRTQMLNWSPPSARVGTAAGELRPGCTTRQPAESATGALRAGLRLVFRTSVLRALLIGSCLYWTANAGLTALLVPLVSTRLHTGGQGLGYLITGLGAGYLAGSAITRRLLTRGVWLIPAAYLAVGGCFLVLVTARSLPVAVAATAAGGLPGAVAMVATGHRLQVATPGELRGRVTAAFRTSDAFAAIAGALAAPALVTLAGLGPALVAFAAVVPAAGLLTAVLLLPRLR
jgi:hypothetical protein